MKTIKLIFFAMLVIINASNVLAVEEIERKESAQIQEKELKEVITRQRFLPGKLLFYSDLYEGHDNNVNLDSSRQGDLFTESYTELGYKHPFTDAISATVDYYLTTVNYHEMTDATFYDNNASLDLACVMFDGAAIITFANRAGYNYYPNEEASTYLTYNPQLSVKHNFNEFTFQRLSYDFIFRDYAERRAQDGSGASKDGDRLDIRNSITHELGGLFFKDCFLKLTNQYFMNESNDQYMDYYDYWSYRFLATAMLPLFTERLYGLVSLGYQRIDYQTRQLVNNTGKTEEDDLYSLSSSLIFDITKRISISLNYSYRQNESNEPSQEYSGGIMSAGFHYAF